MTKGWEFFWEGRRYCVGARCGDRTQIPPRPISRRSAARAKPKGARGVIASGLQLKEGTVRMMSGMSGTRPT